MVHQCHVVHVKLLIKLIPTMHEVADRLLIQLLQFSSKCVKFGELNLKKSGVGESKQVGIVACYLGVIELAIINSS